MSNGGRIVWDLDIEDRSFTDGLKKASGQAKSTADQINRIDFRGIADKASNSFNNIANSIQRTAVVIGGLGLAAGGFFLKSAADLQQTSRSFEVLTGNVEVAGKLFGELADFAAKTPFEFPQLAKAGQVLLGFGRSSEQVFPDIKVLGDIAAATGADFQSLAVVFGQVNATGKLMGQDALQLINNNIPVTTVLAKNLGISVQEVKQRMEDGAITADIFNKALLDATKQGGFAFQGTEKLATTLNGRLSTLKDTVLEFGRNLLGVKVDPELGLVVEPGGLFDRFSLMIPRITDSLIEMTPKIVAAFGWLIDHGDLIVAILVGVTAAFVAAKIAAIALAIVALGPLGLTVGAIIIGIGLLAAGAFLLVKNWEKVKQFFIGLGQSIAGFFSNAGVVLVNAGRALIGGLVNGLNSARDAVVSKIREIAAGALDAIKRFFGIKSPSAVMADQGEFMMMGLAQGIQNSQRLVSRAIQNSSSNILDQFNGPGSNPLALDVTHHSTSPSETGGSPITINQQNIINRDVDLEAANRELGWRLAV